MGIRIVSAVALLCACLSSPAQAQKVEWPTSIAPHPSAVAFDGSRTWVGHRDDATGQAVVSKLDAASGTLLLTVGGFVHVSGVAYDASTDSIWVADQGANTLTKLQALDGTVSLTVRDGLSMPMGILIDGPHVWVANFASDSVSKLDAEGNVLGTFPAGSGPAYLAADADGNIWVTNYKEDTVTKLSAEDGSVLGTFPTDAAPADGASRGTFATAEGPRVIAAEARGSLLAADASANTLASRALSNPCGGGAFALSGTSASCTFGPGSYNFIIPPDVWSETIHVYGAQGGHAGPDQQGGYGGYVGASASVTPGYALVITVGGQGGSAFRNDAGTPCPYCAGGQGGGGGYNGGAPGGNGGSHQSSGQSGFAGGGGGGRSQVDFYANGEGHIIAGGGGGGGGNGGDNYCRTVFGITTCKRFPGGSGGFGGTTGSSGGNGHYFDGITGIGGGGGGGASVSAGGAGGRGWYVVEPRGPGGSGGSLGAGGGASSGGYGTSFVDGNGNTFGGGGGGGGGGGYYGGGGGAGGIGTATLNDSGGGGGGGGGSSHWYGPGVLSITSASAARSGDGLVVVTWSLQTQTITFTSAPPSPGQAPGSYVVSAYGGGSGNPVVFSVAGACTLSGSTVSFSSAGTCTVYANQEGNGGYLDAGQVQQSFNIVQDTTPPVLAPTVAGTLGNNGWYTSDVQVSWSVTDPDSAISSSSGCGNSTVSADTTGMTFTCTATSAGGTASRSVTVKRDATAPVVTANASRPADHNGWYNHPLTVSFSATDATSGVTACDAPQAYSGPDTATATVSGGCTDQAGNNSTDALSFKYDATAPAVIASASRPADSNGWYNHALTINFTGTDATSGIAQCDAPKNYGGPDTASTSLSGSCSDQAGNTSAGALTFKYDATAASVAYLGNAGSYTVDQTVNIMCAPGDNLSGVASTTCQNISGPAYSFNIAANPFAATATDYAGNTGSGSTVFTVNATPGSVCTLAQRFVANKGIGNSLCAKLEKSKAGPLTAFENEVAAQTGKALTPAQAAVLVRLARVLSGQ